jgi:hypothetical protein
MKAGQGMSGKRRCLSRFWGAVGHRNIDVQIQILDASVEVQELQVSPLRTEGSDKQRQIPQKLTFKN